MKGAVILNSIILLAVSFLVKAEPGDTSRLNRDSSYIENSDPSANRVFGISYTAELKQHEQGTLKIIQQYYLFQNTFPSSLLQHAEGSRVRKEERRMPVVNENWQFFVLVFLLALLAIIRYSYSKEWDEINQVLRNWFPARPMRREMTSGTSLGTILFTVFAALALPFYVFALVHQSGINFSEPDWMVAVFLAAGIAAVILFRYLLLEMAAWLLPDGKNVKAYNISEMQINRTWSVFLFPFIPLILFVPDPFNSYFWWVSLLVCAFFILLRILRGMSYGGSAAGRNFFHFLLYICSLEIAPIFILIRFLEHMTSSNFSFLKPGG